MQTAQKSGDGRGMFFSYMTLPIDALTSSKVVTEPGKTCDRRGALSIGCLARKGEERMGRLT